MVYSLSLSLSLSLSPSLGVPVSEAAVIDLNQVSGNEIVLTEDSSLLQSYLPTISKGETFAIKGKHTFTIGPSDASAMVDTYANATLQVEGSLSLIGNEAFGAMHTNQGSTIAIDEDLFISGTFKTSGIELVGVRSDTTIEPSTLTIGNNLLIHDATFSGSGPYVIQLQNSDIDAKNIKFENIKRTATSNGPFYLLGLMGNSSNVKAEGIEFLEVNSDTGFRAIEIGLPDSTLEVGYIDINNLTAKNGSYLGYSAGISSAGSVTATNEIRISNLEANTDDLFAVYAEGLTEKDTGQTYLSSLQTETLTIKNVKSLEKSAAGILSDLGKFNIKSIAIDGVSAKVNAAGVVLSNISRDSDFGHIKISNISGGVSSSGLQADNLTLSNGLEISNITSESGNAAAIVAMPVHEDDPGLVVNTTPGIANVIEGDLLTLSDSTDQTKQTKGKLTASFDGQASSLTGVSGFLCLGRLFQGQPNEAALCI